jgi:thiosulfate dehydrogenase (quinone) large subunit
VNTTSIDPRPFWIRWRSRDWAFFLLQIFLGFRFLCAGLGKFQGPQGLSFQHFYSQVRPALSQPFLEKTFLPAWSVQLYLGTLPYAEILLGAGILVAGKNRGPLLFAGFLYVSLAFGQMLIGGHTTVADIGIHLGLVVAALLLVDQEQEAKR